MSGATLDLRHSPGPAAPVVDSGTAALRRRWLGRAAEAGHFEEIPAWTLLRTGDLVEIRRGGALVRCGWVDDLTADGTVLWINAVDGGRILFHAIDEVQVWRRNLRG